jgi:protease I
VRVAFLAADMVEQVELREPWQAVEQQGWTPQLVSLQPGQIQGFDHFDPADTFTVDTTVEEVSPDDFDALVLPGGVGNPDVLRMDENAVAFVRGFFDAGKPVAAICHAPWLLIEAGVARDRRIASWPSLQTDLRNAGATWVDEEVVRDGALVTSRKPDDLPAFTRELVALFRSQPVSAGSGPTS